MSLAVVELNDESCPGRLVAAFADEEEDVSDCVPAPLAIQLSLMVRPRWVWQRLAGHGRRTHEFARLLYFDDTATACVCVTLCLEYGWLELFVPGRKLDPRASTSEVFDWYVYFFDGAHANTQWHSRCPQEGRWEAAPLDNGTLRRPFACDGQGTRVFLEEGGFVAVPCDPDSSSGHQNMAPSLSFRVTECSEQYVRIA